MPQKTLFSLDDPIPPDPNRPAPVLWLRRLVILSKPDTDPSSIIRNLEFRRGLNVIKTELPSPTDRRVAGHSVGKTLLMRLIRYAIGEDTFAHEDTRAAIAEKLPSLHLVAHWSIDGEDWVVSRPVRNAEANESFAIKSDDWRAALATDGETVSWNRFLTHVAEVVMGGLPEFKLPKGGRVHWIDVLGWLARDCQCGYRKSNEWRHPDAQSLGSIDREENGLILQWMSGLMKPQEIELRDAHRKLLVGKTKAKRSSDREERRAETLRPSLWKKLGFNDGQRVLRSGEQIELIDDESPESEAAGETSDDDAEVTPKYVEPSEKVAEKVKSLQRLVDDARASAKLGEQKEKIKSLQEKLIQAIKVAERSTAKVDHIKASIQQKKLADAKRGGDPYAACEAEPSCFMRDKLANLKQKPPEPARDELLQQLEESLPAAGEEVKTAIAARDEVQSAHDTAVQQYEATETKLNETLSGIDRLIGQWESYRDDVSDYESSVKAADLQSESVVSLEKEVRESEKRQKLARDEVQFSVNRFSECYEQVLQHIFGDLARGEIVIDAKGMRPAPDRKLAPAGAALSVMTTVLGFDLACVVASTIGIGHHPRLLLHDSPREGDMEGHLFYELFDLAIDMEKRFAPEEPSFQYIITTTTTPPPEITDKTKPYIIETLDARDDNERLLRVAF